MCTFSFLQVMHANVKMGEAMGKTTKVRNLFSFR